jgi:mutual gliding-motility protein MglA
MVFFNYSRMQMAAKIVYYGPGLCGKTTNLHWIYGHTQTDSRGEMVSLETETDRTLFFDLLPIDVGNIAGFDTRLQLYTVPGQVFYNTTRKLVLKGVDGVVFVADSQRPMLQANLDSFRNLEENLGDMGLSLDSLPVVLQYNKRDLADVLSVEELNRSINRKSWPWFEAAAVQGKGVFETLKGISKLTLVSLKTRLSKGTSSSADRPLVVVAEEPPKPAPARPATPPPSAPPKPAPAPAPPAPAPAAPKVAAPRAPEPAPQAAARKGKAVDAMGELEKLRREAFKAPAGGGPVAPPPGKPAARGGTSPGSNGGGQLFRDIQMSLKRADFQRARRFSVTLLVEDEAHQVVDAVRGLEVDIDDPQDLDKVLLKLNIQLHSKD